MSDMDPKRQERLRSLSIYWSGYYDRLDQMIAISFPKAPKNPAEPFDYAKFKEEMKLHDAQRLLIIKRHISASHTWIPGKMHWTRKGHDDSREYQAPLECSVCNLGASLHEVIEFQDRKIDFANGEMPSRDMHGLPMHRTCQDVLDAHKEYRKKRKGKKCGQCRTYGCLDND